jgi:hypothetical protein
LLALLVVVVVLLLLLLLQAVHLARLSLLPQALCLHLARW